MLGSCEQADEDRAQKQQHQAKNEKYLGERRQGIMGQFVDTVS